MPWKRLPPNVTYSESAYRFRSLQALAQKRDVKQGWLTVNDLPFKPGPTKVRPSRILGSQRLR